MNLNASAAARTGHVRFMLRGSRRGIVALCAVSLIAAISEAFLLAAVAQAVAALSGGTSDVTFERGFFSVALDVRILLGLAVAAGIVRATAVGVAGLLGPRLAANTRRRLRRQLFKSYLEADWATQSAEKSGRLQQTLSTSVNDATGVVAVLTQAVPAVLTLIVLLVVSLVINPVATAVLIVLGAAVGFALQPISRRAHRDARGDAQARNATASHVAGVLAAGAEITVLGARQGVLDAGLSRIALAERSFARAQGAKRVVSTAGQSLALLFAATALWILSIGDFVVDFAAVGTIAVLLLRGAGLAQQIQSNTSQLGTITPFVEQIRALVDTYEAKRQRYGTASFPTEFTIHLNDVEYSYPGTNQVAIRAAGVRFEQGSSTAVVGPSGSGKSTLIQLILRLRAPTAGEVQIGSIPAQTISEEEFSRSVAYVPQAPHLIPGTLEENITFFRPQVTRDDVIRAAQMAHLHEEILEMPDGYETMLDTHVDALSGGQKQRLALARALTGSPRVLVLDEPTSALDQTNETAVMDTLLQLKGKCTVIVITHRPSAAAMCDAVFTVESGHLTSRTERVPPGARPQGVPTPGV